MVENKSMVNRVSCISIAIMFLMTGLMIIPEGITQDAKSDVVTGSTEIFYPDATTSAQLIGGE
jgi:hypothetical protein